MTPTDLTQLLGELASTIDLHVELGYEGAHHTAARARAAAEELGRWQQADPGLDDLIDQAWRLHETTGYLGERFMYERDFDGAVHWVLARFGGGEVK